MPRRKKDPSVRSRRNKASTAATLRQVSADATPRDELEKLTRAQLLDEVARRNADRAHADQIKAGGRASKAQLVEAIIADDKPEIPDLGLRLWRNEDGVLCHGEWHPRVVAWWADVWSSPMHREWDDSDIHNLYLLALILEDVHSAPTAKARKEAAAEFRLQRADLGLSPYSRRRLEWTIEQAGAAQDAGAKRRQAAAAKGPAPSPAGSQAQKGADPRAILMQ